ncbi:hypothetical protein MSPP1_000756 [Malassezia sp. CBS 17886]|nr:hypothetical protein MSPP1_000756 [Malassezia sp. CBS 17886]
MDALSLQREAAQVARNVPFSEQLVANARAEIAAWLSQAVHMAAPSVSPPRPLIHDQGDTAPPLVEIRRTPTMLVWRVDDASHRFAVHCVARTLHCPSFSRTEREDGAPANVRHTWILHPNPLLRGIRSRRAMSRPRHRRTSSASTMASAASSAATNAAPTALAAGLLQGVAGVLATPPGTESEFSEDTDAYDSEFVELSDPGP